MRVLKHRDGHTAGLWGLHPWRYSDNSSTKPWATWCWPCFDQGLNRRLAGVSSALSSCLLLWGGIWERPWALPSWRTRPNIGQWGKEDPAAIRAGDASPREMAEAVKPEKQRSRACGTGTHLLTFRAETEYDEKVTGLEQPGISETVQR